MKEKDAEPAIAGLRCLRHAHRAMLECRLIGVSLLVLAASVLVFTVLSPLGIEDSLVPFQRLAFLALCGVCCWPFCHALNAAVLYVGRALHPLQIILACVAVTLFMALPSSTVAVVIFELFQPRGEVRLTISEVYLNAAVAALACTGIIDYVACQRAKLWLAIERRRPEQRDGGAAEGKVPATVPEPEDDALESLLGRLPDMLGPDIVYITVSGHYINVVTTEGSCLILMRLADAVAALGDSGLQVHRSYWVAHRHIVGVQRVDGRVMLRLTGAHQVPVSRTYRVAAEVAVAGARRRCT